jgi:N-acetylmuramate 1-kinase
MTERDRRIATFLDAAGWGQAVRETLAGDASFRRYDRLADGACRAVLMDAPPPREDVRPFANLARHLRHLGLSAPEIMAEDNEAGLLLLEDLGDHTYTRLLGNGADEKALYALAVDVLIDLHRRPAAEVIPAGLPPYDDGRLLDEACLFTDWYMPAILGHPTTPDIRQAYVEAWSGVFSAVHAQPRTLVLRDYHVDNLMRLDGRHGLAACGLLDFQDAVAGAAAYDLVSLLEDARRDIAPDLTAAMLERYISAFPEMDLVAFEAAYVILGAQRHAKVIGIFTRLCRRDGKPHYLVHIPRLWRLFEHALEHPVLSAVAQWVDRHVPPKSRENPPCQAAAQ